MRNILQVTGSLVSRAAAMAGSAAFFAPLICTVAFQFSPALNFEPVHIYFPWPFGLTRLFGVQLQRLSHVAAGLP